MTNEIHCSVGVVEDSYALSVACKQTLTSLLRLLNAYRHESDYTVLSHVTSVSNLTPPIESIAPWLHFTYVTNVCFQDYNHHMCVFSIHRYV